MTEQPTSDPADGPVIIEMLTDEDAIAGMVRMAAEHPGGEEHAVMPVRPKSLPEMSEQQAEVLRNLPALRGLARSRGLDLEAVLRAALHDDLAAIVGLPAVESRGGAT